MVTAIFDDDEIRCPECGSPEKRESDVETVGNTKVYIYVCECGNTYTITKRYKEER